MRKEEPQEYLVTEAAGETVGGFVSPGSGKKITMLPSQAEQPLRQGYLEKTAEKQAEVKPPKPKE